MALTKSQKINSIAIGTSQIPWQRPSTTLSARSTAVDALGTYSHLTALPTQDPAGGVFLLGPFDPTSSVALRFHGTHGTDADGKTFAARIWLLDELVQVGHADNPVEYLGFPQLDLSLTIGNTSLNTASKIVTGVTGNLHKAVDTISATADYTRASGYVIGGSANDAWPFIMWDRVGSPYMIVQLSLNSLTATGAGVMFREL